MQRITILSILCALITISAVAIYAMWQTEEKYDRIYVLDEGHSIWMTRRESALEDRPLEAKAHLRLFHEMFFTLSPNSESWDEALKRSLEMGGESVRTLYEDLKESRFYERLHDTGAIQRIIVDSIQLLERSYPIQATTFSRQIIERESVTESRLLITECVLSQCPRTYSNPHGFLVNRFRITKNSALERKHK